MSKVVIPKRVLVGGHWVKVRLVGDDELAGTWGDYSRRGKVIRLNCSEDWGQLVPTLRHELMHAALDIGGVAWCERMEEEAIVRCMDEIFWPAWDRLGL